MNVWLIYDSMTRLAVLLLLAALSLPPMAALGKCVSDSPIDYNDVDAVLITTRYRALDGYLSGYTTTKSATIADSRFWALFWNDGNQPTRYAQFSIPKSVGTYELSASLQDAVAILKMDRFYNLAPQRERGTDQTYSAITVRRCAVVTRLIQSNAQLSENDPIPMYRDAATSKLFDDLWNLISTAKKKQVSPIPERFELQLIFDQ
jgi:hypothetical protein